MIIDSGCADRRVRETDFARVPHDQLTQAVVQVADLVGPPDDHRRILTQLNRGESRHTVARAIFHGQRGELRQRYREGQEDQLGALGLVVNAVVLWNTRYLDASLTKVRSTDVVVKPEDVQRLSPLLLDHVNVLGRYEFALKESIRQGQLRPLREPNEMDDLAA